MPIPGAGDEQVLDNINMDIPEGQTTKQIASELGIAPFTVKSHRRNICAELELRGPNALIRWSIENKGQLL